MSSKSPGNTKSYSPIGMVAPTYCRHMTATRRERIGALTLSCLYVSPICSPPNAQRYPGWDQIFLGKTVRHRIFLSFPLSRPWRNTRSRCVFGWTACGTSPSWALTGDAWAGPMATCGCAGSGKTPSWRRLKNGQKWGTKMAKKNWETSWKTDDMLILIGFYRQWENNLRLNPTRKRNQRTRMQITERKRM